MVNTKRPRSSLPFALFCPKQTPVRQGVQEQLLLNPTPQEALEALLPHVQASSQQHPLVLDLETNGTKVFLPNVKVVGVGFASNYGRLYLNLEQPDVWSAVIEYLYTSRVPLAAHNVFFDAAFLTRDLNLLLGEGKYPEWFSEWRFHNWTTCTLAAYKHLASEGWEGQQWGLKSLMEDLLLWEETNERGIDRWLVEHGHTTRPLSKTTAEKLQLMGWDAFTAEEVKDLECRAHKGEMWRCPPAILGAYCLLDVEATYLFQEEHLNPLLNKFSVYEAFHRGELMNLERLLIVQELMGIKINETSLKLFRDRLVGEVAESRSAFLSYPAVAEAVKALNLARIAEDVAPQQQFLKGPKEAGEEPAKYTKKGAVNQNWTKWEARRMAAEAYAAAPEMTVAYTKWLERHTAQLTAVEQFATLPAERAEELGLFNLNSSDQKIQLFYEHMKFEIKVWTDPGEGKEPRPSTDAEAVQGFGEAGKLYAAYADKEKLLQMVTGCLNALVEHGAYFACDAQEGGWYLHPQVKVPGALTGRLGGAGGVNVQNIPKIFEYLSCFIHRDTCLLLEADAASLEPHVMTERSRDEQLMKVYGPDANKAQDIYLLVGNAFPGIGDKFRSCGYDPDAPTKEAVGRCKKEYGKYRQASKRLHLSASYSAGPGKWLSILLDEKVKRDDGSNYTLADARHLHQAYWQLFAGVKRYENWLKTMWERNKGWTLNPIGRPQCCDKTKLKDIINNDCQGGGHDILMIMLNILTKKMWQAGVRFRPWMVDVHDEYFFEIHEDDKELALEINKQAEEELNQFLHGKVCIKFGPQCIHNWAEAKLE